ncbi:isopenicillin N synthase family dioxygenase [Halopseudomonas pelagia]|uniref:isopenicillin N synthase family dioxygenase n=1 Tax=Halopseudomonas pelagia TaxID=553151 RepID=UPI00039B444E|nr:2-oxoglutarate and iron-dependent oxygenase domain-containing protein [Halopseudomonas pelagia]|tara:strand:+ start:126434 stop:127384 length:951 start_codon:yes stop_codon:yes gene_type:complete
MKSLPIISVSGLRSQNPDERAQVARQLGIACREVGFFYVIDHGIGAELVKDTFNNAKRFFALPLADKQGLSIKLSPHNRGYVAMADEKLNPASGADMKEAFNIGTDFPADHPDVLAGKPFRGVNFWPAIPGWREEMLTYFDACLDLGRLIHRGFSIDLGLAEDYFDTHLTSPIATLRMLHYPASAGQSQREDGGAGAHTDYGNLTLLATDQVAGLQVANRQGQWIEAPHVPGAFVCNIGDCLMRWSNDTYVSTPHRVRPPEQERYSMAFFLEVNPESIVDPRDILPDQQPKYAPISCSDYLTYRLNATYEHRTHEQ